jgi:hypothetical protein
MGILHPLWADRSSLPMIGADLLTCSCWIDPSPSHRNTCTHPLIRDLFFPFWMCVQGKEGKVTAVYRRKWVIHIERVTREKTNGACCTSSVSSWTAASLVGDRWKLDSHFGAWDLRQGLLADWPRVI